MGNVRGEKSDSDKVNITLEGASIESVMAKEFTGKGSKCEARVTEVQRRGFWSTKR